jgi:hypothetical protein
MGEETALVPLEERRVDFYGDEIVAMLVPIEGESRIYVPVKLLCDYIGLDWASQRKRINRDEVLSTCMVIMTMQMPGDDQKREHLVLPLSMIPGWLFGITTARVKPQLKEKIIRYQRECFDVLWDAFRPQILPTVDLSPPSTGKSGAELAYEIATAVQHLARQQLDMEQRLERASQWAQSVNREITDLRSRVDSLELQVSGGAPISEQQAAEVALAVKNVGRALEVRGQKSGYSQVYAEMYRRYGISSYKNLPRDSYDEVLAWLRQWYSEVAEPTL